MAISGGADPSITFKDGWFHLVFTTELCAGLPTIAFHCDRRRARNDLSARFGYARSRDLVNWVESRPVHVPLPGACNVWAPEWHLLEPAESASAPPIVDGKAATALVVFSATVPHPHPHPLP